MTDCSTWTIKLVYNEIIIPCYYPRESEGVCFYRRWFVCLSVCPSVCLSVTTITKKIVDGFVPNFMRRFLWGKGVFRYDR